MSTDKKPETNEYKNTLNLPQTEFAMKANLVQREPEMLSHWQQNALYQQIRQARKGAKKFILHDGPPYANGHIHIGHALNKVLKDIVVKAKTLSGYDAPYVPGWDCHGLPIELNVEKKLGKAGFQVSADTFRAACREYALSQVNVQSEEFQRLGVLGDWEHPYLTMDFHYEATTIRALGKLIGEGYLVQGFKPIHWCIDCQSALAEAEVEYKDKKSRALDVAFRVIDEANFLGRLHHTTAGSGLGPISLPIWTTTPWTLPANQAVAVAKDLKYVLAECNTVQGAKRLFVAEPLINEVMTRYGIEDYRIIAYGQGEDLLNLRVAHPFYNRDVPIIVSEHVTTEVGTGIVHTAPAHGPEDYLLGLQYHLPMDHAVGPNGVFLETAPIVGGHSVLKVDDHLIAVLEENGNLLKAAGYEHSYPHCWRHKTPVIFRATPQWFINLNHENLRARVLEAIMDNVKWIPDWGQARMVGMIEGRTDWCISRQRSWGTPIPIFIHKKTQQLHPDTTRLIEVIAEKVENKGIEAWFALNPEELLGADVNDYIKVNDTLDVWFDSGVSHTCVLQERAELDMPADLYLEGSDQHRGWFQSALWLGMALHQVAPYREVLTHGFTVDAEGRKMSKSLGNVVAPEQVMKKYGADILRLWVSATDYRAELCISDEILTRIADAYRRIRNTARFLLANLFDFDKAQAVPYENLCALDRWVIKQARDLQQEIIEAYDSYNFHVIYQKIHHFCINILGSFYLDVIKDRQYTAPKNSLARRSCQTAMYHIIQALVRWLAPILSFTAEEIWRYLPDPASDSVFMAEWYTGWPSVTATVDENVKGQEWVQIIELRDRINKELEKKRQAGEIGSSLAAEIYIYANPEWANLLNRFGEELRFVFIVSEAKVQAIDSAPQNAANVGIPGILIEANITDAEKCARCWQRRHDVGQDHAHPTLCSRCVTNVTGEGEKRLFA